MTWRAVSGRPYHGAVRAGTGPPPLRVGDIAVVRQTLDGLLNNIGAGGGGSRGLHSFPFQLNLSTSCHRMTQLNS